MQDGRLKKLYSSISAKYDIGTYDEWSNAMLDEGRRKKFFDNVSAVYDIGDYEKFNGVVDNEIVKPHEATKLAENAQKPQAPATAQAPEAVQTTAQPQSMADKEQNTASAIPASTEEVPQAPTVLASTSMADLKPNEESVPKYMQNPWMDKEKLEADRKERKAVLREYGGKSPLDMTWEEQAKLREAEVPEGAERAQDVKPYYNEWIKPELYSEEAKAQKKANENTEAHRHKYQDAASPATIFAQNWSTNVENEKITDPKKVMDKVTQGLEDVNTPKGKAMNDLVLKRIGMTNSNDDSKEESAHAPQLTYGEINAFQRYYGYEFGKIAEEIQKQMYDEYKQMGAPKSTLEYIVGGVAKDNITNVLFESMLQKAAKSSGIRQQMRDAAYEEASKNVGFAANVAKGIGDIATDPAFVVGMGAGSVVGEAATNLIGKTVAKKMIANAGKTATKELVEAGARYAVSNIPSITIASGALASGMTLGTTSALHTGANQVKTGEFDGGEIAGAFGRDFLLGTVTGGISSKIAQATKYSGRLAQVGAAAGTYTTNVGAFSAFQLWQKAQVEGKDVSDLTIDEVAETVGENAATFAVLDLPKFAKSMRARTADARKAGMDMTPEMIKELKDAGYEDMFKGLMEIADAKPEGNGMTGELAVRGVEGPDTKATEESRNKMVLGKLNELVKDDKISSETKRRMYWYATGQMLMPEAVFGVGNITPNEDGKYTVSTENAQGKRIETREFKSIDDARKWQEQFDVERQANMTSLLEQSVFASARNIHSSLLDVAQERGMKPEDVNRALALLDEVERQSKDGQLNLTPEETQLYNQAVELRDDILSRAKIASEIEGKDILRQAKIEVKAETGVDVDAIDRTKKRGLFGDGMSKQEQFAVDTYINKLSEQLHDKTVDKTASTDAKESYQKGYGLESAKDIKDVNNDVLNAEQKLLAIPGGEAALSDVEQSVASGKPIEEVMNDIRTKYNDALGEAARLFCSALNGLKGMEDRIKAMVEAQQQAEADRISPFVVQAPEDGGENFLTPGQLVTATYNEDQVYVTRLTANDAVIMTEDGQKTVVNKNELQNIQAVNNEEILRRKGIEVQNAIESDIDFYAKHNENTQKEFTPSAVVMNEDGTNIIQRLGTTFYGEGDKLYTVTQIGGDTSDGKSLENNYDQSANQLISVAELTVSPSGGYAIKEGTTRVLKFEDAYNEQDAYFERQNDKVKAENKNEESVDLFGTKPENNAENTPESPLTVKSELEKKLDSYKKQNPDGTFLFRQEGESFEAYREDAETLSEVLGLPIKKHESGMNMVTFPLSSLGDYLPKLVEAGVRVGISDVTLDGENKPKSSRGTKTETENVTSDAEKNENALVQSIRNDIPKDRISSEIDQNGSPFLTNKNGSINFGEINEGKNLPVASLRMSVGDKDNGYIHTEIRHGGQIRNAGFNSVLDFVEYVAGNYNLIKKGNAYDNESGGQNQSYLLQLTDGHNNTLWVQMSRDGKYYNINSAGIMSSRYGKNKETIWSASEVQNEGSATNNASQFTPNAEGANSNGTASMVSSNSKDTPSSTDAQIIEAKNASSTQIKTVKRENKNSLQSRISRLQPDEMSRWEDYVLAEIGGGVKFTTKDTQAGSKSIVKHVTGRKADIPLFMLDNTNGDVPEVIAHNIWENMPERLKEQCDAGDVFEEIISIIRTYPNYSSMVDDLESRQRETDMDEDYNDEMKDKFAQDKGFADYADMQAHDVSRRKAREQIEKSIAKMDAEQLKKQLTDYAQIARRAQEAYKKNSTPNNFKKWDLDYVRYKAIETALQKAGTYDNNVEGFFDGKQNNPVAEIVHYDFAIDPVSGKEVYTKTDANGKVLPSTSIEFSKARRKNPEIATSKEDVKRMRDEFAFSQLKKAYPSVTNTEEAQNAIEAITKQIDETELTEDEAKVLKSQVSDLKRLKNILGREETDVTMENTESQLSDFSEKDQERIREASKWITKKDAKRMLEMAYNIAKPYFDEYKSFDAWVKETPTSEITMIVDNEFSIQDTFLNPIYEKTSGFGNDFWSDHLVDAYKLNLLDDGNAKKPQAQRINLGNAVKVSDGRFYAPKQIEIAEGVLDVAKQRINKSNEKDVLSARQNIVLYAHNEGAAETLGMTKAEFNKLLRGWTRESAKARELSLAINKGVEESNRWSGIENVAATNAYAISDEEIARMTAGVEGDSNGMMRKDIARTMLAIDTHTDWSGVKIKFSNKDEFEKDFGSQKDPKKVSGFYVKKDRLVEVRIGKVGHTTPHEMGHALDHTWGLELGFNDYLTHSKSTKLTGDAKLFADHLNEFITELIKSNADIRNDYTTDRTEVFARFVDYFVNYTESVANNIPLSRNQYFEDKFTAANVVEFVKILQEKSVLDSQRMATAYREAKIQEEAKVKKQNDDIFNAEIDAFKAKEHKGLMHLGKPLAKLQVSGINAEELTMSPSSLSRHLKKYGLEADDVKGLASAIQDPILVYKHGLKVPNIVVVTELDVKGGKLSISVQIDESGNVVELNNVRSVHAKDAEIELERLSEYSEDELRNALKWVEKEKVSDWFSAADLSRPMHTVNPKLDSVAKILNEHENPDVYAMENSISDAQISQNDYNAPDLQSEDDNDVNFMIELTDAGNREVWEHGKQNIPGKIILVKDGMSGAVTYGSDARKVYDVLGRDSEKGSLSLNGADVMKIQKALGDDVKLISYEDAEGNSYLDKNVGRNAVLDDYNNKNAAQAITFNPEYEMYRTEIKNAFEDYKKDGNNQRALIDAAEDYVEALQMVVDKDVDRRVTDGAAKIFAKEIAKVEAYIDDILDGKVETPEFGNLVKQTADGKKAEIKAGNVEPEEEIDYFSGDTLELGNKLIPLRNSEVGHIKEQARRMPVSSGNGWKGVEPQAVVITSNIRSRYPELHKAAKNGDALAAYHLVAQSFGFNLKGGHIDTVKLGTPAMAKVVKLKSDHPNAIVTYPHRDAISNGNVLGQVYADFLQDVVKFEKNDSIFMINRPKHTDASKDSRLLKRARFEGDVEPGREYIIVDDHITMGCTVRDMKDYIESKGGKVVAVSTLTKSMGDAASLVPTEEDINSLIELGVTNEQLKEFGITDDINNLTRGESRHLRVLSKSGRNRRGSQKSTSFKRKDEGHIPSSGKASRRVGGKSNSGNEKRVRTYGQEEVEKPYDVENDLYSTANERIEAPEKPTAVPQSAPTDNAVPIAPIIDNVPDETDILSYAKTAVEKKPKKAAPKKAKKKEYKTQNGEKIEYKQLNLFDEKDLERLDKKEAEVMKTILSPEGYRIEGIGDGSECFVERRYTENGMFEFNGSEKITSPDDVAYLFRSLEDRAVENTFAVLIDKDSNPTILHTGIGNMTASVFDNSALPVAVEKIKPVALFMVHNHPSGKLTPSSPDKALLQRLKNRYGSIVQDGIIIDTLSGKYAQFNSLESSYKNIPEKADGEVTHKVYTFDKLVFGKSFDPNTVMYNANDVASWLSSHRLGDHNKTCVIGLGHNATITGNFALPVNFNTETPDEIASKIVPVLTASNSNCGILYGNGIDFEKAKKVAANVSGLGSRIVDVCDFNGKKIVSAATNGLMESDMTDILSYAQSKKGYKHGDTVSYRTQDGKIISYTQLDLFGNESNGDNLTPIDYRIRPLKKGEICLLERRYTENGMFKFDGSEKIEGPDDVAYMFRTMQENATANSFFVLVDKDGKPTVIHSAMGDNTNAPFDVTAPQLAIQEINPVKIYPVINHPGGRLNAHKGEIEAYKKLVKRYGKIVKPVIVLDTKSGKYGQFDTMDLYEKAVPTEGGSYSVKVYSFDKQVFGKDFEPKTIITTGKDVSEFLSSQRFGERPKQGVLILNNNSNITGNYILNIGDSVDADEIAKEIARLADVTEGKNCIIYGDGLNTMQWQETKDILKSMEINLLDAVNPKPRDPNEKYISAAENGWLREPTTIYTPQDVVNEENMLSEAFGPDDTDDPEPQAPELAPGEILTDDSYRAKHDEYVRQHRAWVERHRAEGRSADEVLYSGDATDAPETGVEALNADELFEKEQFSDMMNNAKIDVTMRAIKSMIKDEIRERRRLIESSNFEDAILAHDIKKVTTPEERKRIPFILEGTDTDPVSDDLKGVVEKIRNWFDDTHNFMSEEGLFMNDERKHYIDNYVTHIWDLENSNPDKVTELRNWVRLNSPYTRDRVIPTIQAGLDMGLKMKYEDITDIMMDYGHYATEAVANRRLVNFLKGFSVDGQRILQYDSVKDADYVRIDNNALDGLKVNKAMVPVLDVIFGRLHTTSNPTLQKIAHSYDLMGGVMKKINLSLSFFHHGALTETALSMMGPVNFSKSLFKNMIWDAAMKKELPAFLDVEATRDAVNHLVTLGATQDYLTKDVQGITANIRKFLEQKNVYGLKEASQLADMFNIGMDTVLWDWLHDGYKIYSFKKIADEIRRKAEKNDWSQSKLNMALDEAGQLVNDTFGGQHWDILGYSPSDVKWARRFLLSPDWTISTIRQALSPFGIGAIYDDRTFWEKVTRQNNPTADTDDVLAVRRKYGTAFWLMAALLFIPFYNSLNALFRKKDESDELAKAEEMRVTDPNYKSPYELAYPDGMKWYDYTMLGNTMGHQTHLFSGRYDDGTEMYLRWGKQFRELPELFFGRDGFSIPGPMIDKLAGKVNPMINLMTNFVGGVSPTGWENPFMKNKRGWEKEWGRVQVLLSSFTPYSIPTDSEKEFVLTDLMMPSAKGFSAYKARRGFETAITSGDIDMVGKVYNACVLNGLNADELFETTLKSIEATARKSMIEGVETVGDACAMYDNESDPKKRAQLARYIKKMLSAQDYTQIEKGELIQKANDVINGESVGSDSVKQYDKLCNSNDVIEDWRLSKAISGLKPFNDEFNRLAETDRIEAKNYKDAHKESIMMYKKLSGYRSAMNDIKRTLGKPEKKNSNGTVVNDQTRLELVRELRLKALSEK